MSTEEKTKHTDEAQNCCKDLAGKDKHHICLKHNGRCVELSDNRGHVGRRIFHCKNQSVQEGLTVLIHNCKDSADDIKFAIQTPIWRFPFTNAPLAGAPQVLKPGDTFELKIRADNFMGLTKGICGTSGSSGKWGVTFYTDPPICDDPTDPDMIVEC